MKSERELKNLVSQMTLDEKVAMCYGDGKMNNHGVPRLGIPSIRMNDGPRGIRIEDTGSSTALPNGTCLASSFSRKTAHRYGEVLGEETLATKTYAILGPGMNLMRSPLCARNFEYAGEDPVLAGEISAAYVQGCQSRGCAACPKHLALNNQETCRRITSAFIDERTLRELYLRPFEITVKKSTPWMLMCSYNKINGIYAAEQRELFQDILKDDWGFDGVVVSDWGAVHTGYRCAVAGIDLEMAGGEHAQFKALVGLVQNGLLPEAVIDDKVLRILKLLDRVGLLDGSANTHSHAINAPEHRIASKEIAQDGMVLLKNNGILPLDAKRVKHIIVTGPSANFRNDMGSFYTCGGSGAVHPEYEITPMEGLRELVGDALEIQYVPGELFQQSQIISSEILQTEDGKPGLAAEYFKHHAELDAPDAEPILTQIDTDFQFHWGAMAQWIALDTAEGPLDKLAFGARWRGFICPTHDGEAELAFAKGGAKKATLKINGKIVLDTTQITDYHSATTFHLTFHKGDRIPIEMTVKRLYGTAQLDFSLNWMEKTSIDETIIRNADAVLYFGGLNHVYDTEAIGLPTIETYADLPSSALPGNQKEYLEALCKLNPNVIVTLQGGVPMDVSSWIGDAAALLMTWYAGMETGRAVAEVIFGKAEPAGRLCCTWAHTAQDHLCHKLGLFPGNTDPYQAASDYLEKMNIGYRYFDTENLPVQFPFGFGLSYTTFSQEVTKVSNLGADVVAEVAVTNTGKRTGSQVIQLYLEDKNCPFTRPAHELVDFDKVTLNPGETKSVCLKLTERDRQVYDEDKKSFVSFPGAVTLQFATSSRDIFKTISVTC